MCIRDSTYPDPNVDAAPDELPKLKFGADVTVPVFPKENGAAGLPLDVCLASVESVFLSWPKVMGWLLLPKEKLDVTFFGGADAGLPNMPDNSGFAAAGFSARDIVVSSLSVLFKESCELSLSVCFLLAYSLVS